MDSSRSTTGFGTAAATTTGTASSFSRSSSTTTASSGYQLRFAAGRRLMDTRIFLLFVIVAERMTSDDPLANIYCPEQIRIPVTFPYILKIYAKAAIRTQPYDLLRWTSAYFRALANCEVPPVKERLEYPPIDHPSGITPGYLKTLLKRFGPVYKLPLGALLQHWQGIDLSETSLYQICLVGGFLEGDRNCEFYLFLAIACGLLAPNLTQTMIYVCELLTEEPEGGSAMIPLGIFLQIYGFLAELDCSGFVPSMSEEEMESEGDFRPCEDLPCSPTATVASFALSDTCQIATSSRTEDDDKDDVVCHVESKTEEEKKEKKDEDESTDTKRGRSSDRKGSGQLGTTVKADGSEAGTIDRQSAPPENEEIRKSDVEEKEKESMPEEEKQEKLRRDAVHASRPLMEQTPNPDGFLSEDDLGDFDLDQGYIGEYEGEWYPDMAGMEGPSLDLGEERSDSCICPIPEVEPTVQTPPTPDPVEEFLKRMKEKIDKEELRKLYRIEGIGPPVSQEQVTAVGLWLGECARRQEGLVGPRNVKHFLCPSLEDADGCQCL